jgi:F-type H+-transporting ATPase subunit alpha
MSSKINNYSEIIKEKIKNYSNTPTLKEEGIVISLGDGIVHASGLDNVMLNEIVIFENGSEGLVLNLEEDVVYIVMLGKFSDIKEKSIVKRTKKIISVPVGDELLGRVINSVGFAIDGKDDIKSKIYMPIERVAPGVMTRKSIDSPLETGILAIDAILPIGKGQRELIIGDRQTGKTTIAIDAIINQKGKNVYCVYVAIGQKNSTVANINRTLSINKSLEYTTIVSSTASDLPALNYLAPFTGIAIAEY